MKMAAVRAATETIEPDAHLVWAPQPGPQMDLLRCPVPDILYGGSRGGGKTDALLGDWAAHAGRSGGRARGIMIRRTMPQLEEIIMRSRELYSPLGARWLAGAKSWLMPDGSYLRMRWLERDADADQYQGHSYDWVGIDEAGGFADPAPIDKMRATMRSAHKVPCVMRLTANPGGPGHQWIKERYVLPAKPRVPHYDPVRKVWRVYIPSRVHDNRALLDADPGYIDRIKSSGPAWLVRAWLDGDWDASAGDIFFTRDILLQDGLPAPVPRRVDYVFAVVDTALKDGLEHDGTAVLYCARDSLGGDRLWWIDWDVLQIEGALLDQWLPTVERRLEALALEYQARNGSSGIWIEDKASGIVLLQQAERMGLQVHAIPGNLTAMGKDGRALNASPHVYQGKVKFAADAYDKITTYREVSRNHLLAQVTSYRLGTKTPHGMDLLDCATYSVAIGLGNSDGY